VMRDLRAHGILS